MLIVYQDGVINLDNVTNFYKDPEDECYIEFCLNISDHEGNDVSRLYFSNEFETGRAYDDIIDAYRWHRRVCDLDRYDHKN